MQHLLFAFATGATTWERPTGAATVASAPPPSLAAATGRGRGRGAAMIQPAWMVAQQKQEQQQQQKLAAQALPTAPGEVQVSAAAAAAAAQTAEDSPANLSGHTPSSSIEIKDMKPAAPVVSSVIKAGTADNKHEERTKIHSSANLILTFLISQT